MGYTDVYSSISCQNYGTYKYNFTILLPENMFYQNGSKLRNSTAT